MWRPTLTALSLAAALSCDGGLRAMPDGSDDSAADTGLADADFDRIPDDVEGRAEGIDTDGDGTPDYLDVDSDNDGVGDPAEGAVDTDNDGVPDFRDPDSDNDGIPDGVEGHVDTDGDGYPDRIELDSDDDGISDAQESGGPEPVDTDGDGLPDFRDPDSDGDGLRDSEERLADSDGDGVPDYIDPRNDGPIAPVQFVGISTAFNSPVGIDFHAASGTVVMSVNYPSGAPLTLERVHADGTHSDFSALSGLTDEVKIATVRPGNAGGFASGELFVGNGHDGQIARVSADGTTLTNPWVDLPGDGNGLMRGSLYVDRTGVWGGDLVVVTTTGQVWRITEAGVPTQVANVGGVHLEGLVTVPDAPARYGPLAGRAIAGAEDQGLIYAFATDGSYVTYSVGVNVEDIDFITAGENFFGVNFGTSRLIGAAGSAWRGSIGDILLTQEFTPAGQSGLYVLRWDGAALTATAVPIASGSITLGQWEHTTFADAGIREVPSGG